jgi:hypothetical protein
MQWTQAFSTIAIVLVAATTGSAGEFAILKEEIVAARSALVTMVLHREKRGPAEQKLVKDRRCGQHTSCKNEGTQREEC